MIDATLHLSDPVFLRNLALYPIQRENGASHHNNGFGVKSIDEVLKSKKGSFCELENPVIDNIIFENNSDEPVLMLDGEEITGAMQNRIVAMSQIAEPHAKKDISVVCVEEQRWDEIGGFKAGYCSYPRLRSLLAQSAVRGQMDAQAAVWKEVERKLTVTSTKSKTSSMHDIFENLQDEIARYMEGYRSLNHGVVGIIGCAGGSILGGDIFANNRTYNKFEKKLIRSYALDAIEYRRNSAIMPDADRFLSTMVTAGLDASKPRTRNRVAHKRIREKGLIGQSLKYNGYLLHLSAFPVALSRA